MKLEPIPKETLDLEKLRIRPRNKVAQKLEEFFKSPEVVCEVILAPGEYSSVNSAQSVFVNAIKKNNYGMYTKIVQGRLFIVKRGYSL